MRIVDSKGMVFGKINIIDLLVVIFLLSLLPMYYYSLRLLTKKVAMPATEYIESNLSCALIKVNPQLIPIIKTGDKETNAQGQCIGRITWVGEPRPFTYLIDIGSGEIQKINDPLMVMLPVKLSLKCERRENKIFYKDTLIQINSLFIFSTKKYTLSCMPIKNVLTKWVHVKVKFPNLLPEISKMINSGHIEKDPEGMIIAKLTNITNSYATKFSAVRMKESKFLLIDDASRNNIEAELDLLCEEKDGMLLFKNFPVKIGGAITFISNSYLVSGLIIGTEDMDAAATR